MQGSSMDGVVAAVTAVVDSGLVGGGDVTASV